MSVVMVNWTKESETRYWMVTQLCSATLVREGKVWTLTAKRDGNRYVHSIGRGANVTARAETLLKKWGLV